MAVGFFGSRYDRATPAERDYMRVMADLGAENEDSPVATADVANLIGRRPQSLSPARDGLIKKGLVFAEERGVVRFTVPHFSRFLRAARLRRWRCRTWRAPYRASMDTERLHRRKR